MIELELDPLIPPVGPRPGPNRLAPCPVRARGTAGNPRVGRTLTRLSGYGTFPSRQSTPPSAFAPPGLPSLAEPTEAKAQ